ncbi:hypothetical protein K474DRAFT_1281039 [Panus rudis PR-1116 ss-1]|nr:hypothetical protein K474DRAFT_1281039 [Panus rudis PR-1116 ss-1]
MAHLLSALSHNMTSRERSAWYIRTLFMHTLFLCSFPDARFGVYSLLTLHAEHMPQRRRSEEHSARFSTAAGHGWKQLGQSSRAGTLSPSLPIDCATLELPSRPYRISGALAYDECRVRRAHHVHASSGSQCAIDFACASSSLASPKAGANRDESVCVGTIWVP